MSIPVCALSSPHEVLERAGDYLAVDPVRHNLILTLLQARVAAPEPGRYWIAEANGACVGVAFQSPLHFVAAITPMADPVIGAVVAAVAGAGVRLPGVMGVAAPTAAFAGRWAEATRDTATPVQGQRIYEAASVTPPTGVAGRLRVADTGEYELLVDWFSAFGREAGGMSGDPAVHVRRRLGAGQMWVWEDGRPVAFACLSDPGAGRGVVRIGPVYTPETFRRRGYASALVAGLSQAILAGGHRAILYADLSNPVSNSIYRAIGYRACAEVLRYNFTSVS